MKKFYLFWLTSKTTLPILKSCSFFTQMIIWCVSNNILEDQNTYPIESWYSRLSRTRRGYLDLASKLARFWKFLYSYYFNQGNVNADKIWRCSQHFQSKYPQKLLLGIFLDVTLFVNMIRSSRQLMCQTSWKRTCPGFVLQSFTKYLRQTLVFMWNSALPEKFNSCFPGDFY